MTAWQGNLKLTYGLEEGQTQLKSSFSRAPFRIQRPFYPEGDKVCHSVIVHTAGGMVGGDRLNLDLDLAPDSHVFLTTSAAGKAYRSDGETCRQTIMMKAQAGAVIEWFPQETILFEDSKFLQTLKVDLEQGAIWAGMDLFRYGRTARGEHFQQGEWRSQTEVWQQGRPLWIDRSVLTGSMSHSTTTLDNYCVMGSFVVLGQSFEPETLTEIRNQLPSERQDYRLGISRLEHGIICRYLGNSTAQGRDLFLKIWGSLRSIYAGCGICIPRVWQC